MKDTIKAIILNYFGTFNLDITTDELELLSDYLLFFGYIHFTEIIREGSVIYINVKSVDNKSICIKKTSPNSNLLLIEDNSITDLTDKVRTDIIKTDNSKAFLYTFNDLQTGLFFDVEKTKKIKIHRNGDIDIPLNLEPDDVLDFSGGKDEISKIISIESFKKIYLLKKNNFQK